VEPVEGAYLPEAQVSQAGEAAYAVDLPFSQATQSEGDTPADVR
jgi:hypothetical protein